MSHPRVLLADDHRLFLDAFRNYLAPTCEVVGAVGDGRALLDAAPALKPDVVVIDVGMPRLNGLEAGRRLKEIMPLVNLIYLTMNEDPDLVVQAMRGGASGYLLKTSAASELLHAIQVAMKGNRYVTPKIEQAMKDAFIRDPEGKPFERELTPRQREVLQLLGEGKSMMEDLGIKTTAELIQMGIKKHVKEAAEILRVTPRTIAFHKYQIPGHRAPLLLAARQHAIANDFQMCKSH